MSDKLRQSSRPAKKEFRFQRFAIADDQCGMKVGTDGVLLGSWANVEGCDKILDIGTGSGLIALMIAQRTELANSNIDAVEISQPAYFQAVDNVRRSPWQDRIDVHYGAIQKLIGNSIDVSSFDLCVCNPPFFENSLPNPRLESRLARHAISLTRNELFSVAAQLLKPSGRLSLILPFEHLDESLGLAELHRFSIQRQTSVRPLPNRKFKRVLIEFGFGKQQTETSELTVESSRHQFTAAYEQLTSKFHLRYLKNDT